MHQMLAPTHSDILNKFIAASSKLVVLQILRAGYEGELQSNKVQQTKNFRSASIIHQCRDILDDLTPFMEFFATILDNPTMVAKDQYHTISVLMDDLGEYYDWGIEELKLKQLRQDLIMNQAYFTEEKT